ncbi:MAG: hypothetical protein CBD91_06150 [Phycisphaeraceae bacterium TMED231]|nr:MAG: hypothetical protein CBD91_06150 [Phycisphaeraceae bacterium TMED231]
MNAAIQTHARELLADLGTADDAVFLGLLFAYFRERGSSNYDESVTQLEHGLQCAALAAAEDGRPHMIVAALLHDVGHLFVGEHDGETDFLEADHDHETVAAAALDHLFPPEVLDPIRLHVPAKRYLCTVDPSYHDGLSRASKRSLELQGGTLSDEERAEMEREPAIEDALRLRRWDDRAKMSDLDVPELEAYADLVSKVRLRN